MTDWNKPVQVKLLGEWVESKVLHVKKDGDAIVMYGAAEYVLIFSPDAESIRNIPEPKKRVPYTFETWPKGTVWVRTKGTSTARCLVCKVSQGGVGYGYGSADYDDDWKTLADLCELSTDDGTTWQPASREE